MVKTLNRTGYTSTKLNKFTLKFLTYLENLERCRVLEIGAAVGFVAKEALSRGAEFTANDIDSRHLNLLQDRIPERLQQKLKILKGRFPEELDFSPCQFDVVIAFQVFHFLTGEEIGFGLKKIHKWLKPNGKLFLTMGTPYVQSIKKYIPVFKEKKEKGAPWPGFFQLKDYCDDFECLDDNPEEINFVDKEILGRALREADFYIEEIEEFNREDFSETLSLDGKECVGAVAVKQA